MTSDETSTMPSAHDYENISDIVKILKSMPRRMLGDSHAQRPLRGTPLNATFWLGAEGEVDGKDESFPINEEFTIAQQVASYADIIGVTPCGPWLSFQIAGREATR